MLRALQQYLYPWRDRVIANAALGPGAAVLDVGCGDGLIAFGVLDQVEDSRVIFSDISQDLLDHARSLAAEMGLLERSRFVLAPADNLSQIEAASVDAVTTRSVLIYVADKQRAFDEFYRVLKPGGRVSIFEPINRFSLTEPSHMFFGYDVSPVMPIARKVIDVFMRLQPVDTDPMLDFDERDLLNQVEKAGFTDIHMSLEVAITRAETVPWETYLRQVPNPKAPSLEEAMQEVLTPQEIEVFTACLRPLVEARQGVQRRALAFLFAVKPLAK